MKETRPGKRKKRSEPAPAGRTARHASRGSSQVLATPPVQLLFTKRALAVCLALIAVTIAIYAPLRHYGFTSLDDPQYVSENPNVAGGLTWRGLEWAFTGIHASYWVPLVWVSHMLDVQLYGMYAGPHHVTNIVFHIANTLLLFGLLYRMTSAIYRSGFVAGLFAIHPLHVESVAWITERKDMLSTLFFMLALCAYVAYVSKPKRSRYLSIVVLFGLGLMAKPMVVTLPFVLLLLDVWPLQRLPLNDARRSAARLVREKLPLFALAAASSITTYFAQQTTGAVVALDAIPLRIRLANALVSYFAYIGKMFWPTRLVLFYPYPLEIPTWWVIGSVVGLIGMSALVIRSARRHPYLLVGWLWYVGTLVPVIGFVQAGTQSMADRFTYIPLIGLFIMVAWAIPDLLGGWPHAKIPLAAAAVLALGGCAIMASVQVRYWKDGFSLWEHALDVTSRNYIAHTNLGIAFSEAGKHNEAVAQYSDALRIKPDLADARNDLGVALANQGRTADAVHEFEEALRIKPDQAASHYNAGVLLRQMGNTTEALRHFEAALALDPNYQDARREYDSLRRRISSK